jgi:hypothetical protein
MKKWLLSAALILSAFASSAIAQTKESLVGTWRLVSHTETTDKGEVKNPDGEHPTGFLTYTADGRVSVIFTHEGRKPLSNLPPESAPREEIFEAFTSVVAYAGSYSVTGDKVTHHIEAAWVQNLVNTDIVRSVKLEGDHLTLSFGPHVYSGVFVPHNELVWERMKPGATDVKK